MVAPSPLPPGTPEGVRGRDSILNHLPFDRTVIRWTDRFDAQPAADVNCAQALGVKDGIGIDQVFHTFTSLRLCGPPDAPLAGADGFALMSH